MEEKNKKFELNIKALDNFEKIMSTKLDEIEELKITSLDKKSKLLNIISLCSNVKTLIIEGDQRIDSDKVLMNIFKPEKLENLILNNVKLPKEISLKRYQNLKMISLNQIRFYNTKEFFSCIQNPENIEIISICDTEMNNMSIKELENFKNLKYLSLDRVQKCKLDDLEFLKQNNKLLKITIINNQVEMNQINNLLKCKCQRNINVDIVDSENKVIENCKLVVNEKNEPEITILLEKLEIICQNINLYKISKINVVINSLPEETYYIKTLKKFKKDICIILNEFSALDIEQIEKIKNSLKVQEINILENSELKQYDVDTYIKIRTEIDSIIKDIPQKLSEIEKFLAIYKILGRQFTLIEEVEKADFQNKTCTKIQMSEILKNCLSCVKIQSNIITGDTIPDNKEHSWNQVLLSDNDTNQQWYNVDLALDMENIKKNKPEYCLLGDKDFLETHIPKAGKNYYCSKSYDDKLIKAYFRTGWVKEKLLRSYLKVTFEKVKRIFKLKNKTKMLNSADSINDNNLEK